MKREGFVLIVVVFLLQFTCGLDTQLNIENPPPFLVQPIPNQSWAGGNLLNAFNLDDYFSSVNNATLTYSASLVENISIVITKVNSSDMVSFYPNESFSGIREVFFYASDGTLDATSNKVTLFVGQDDEPPEWSFMEKNKGVIYQSDSVLFTSNWTDNLALKNYTLSINQGYGYQQYYNSFSGIANQSNQAVQISAASGQTVFWFFCARDTSSNQNCTDVEEFVVSARSLPASPAVSGEDNSEDSSITEKIKEVIKNYIKDYSVSVSSFLVSLKQGSAQTKILEITNTGNTDLDFVLRIIGLEGFAVLSHKNIFVAAGDTKKITIDFFAEKDTIPGEYFGELLVDSVTNMSIPIIFEINALEADVEAKVNILPGYEVVKPGNVVVANITLKNLKDPIDGGVDLYYSIIDFYGNTYASGSEKVDLTSSVTFVRNLTVSDEIPLGEYLFHVRASNEDKLLSIASDVFEVGLRLKFLAFIKSTSIFLLITLMSLFSILLVLRYKSIAKRKQHLNLYVLSLELKRLMAEQKFDEAVSLFIKMKNEYGETITKETLENKELLKQEMKILADKFDLEKNVESIKNSAGEKDFSKEESNKKPDSGIKKGDKNGV